MYKGNDLKEIRSRLGFTQEEMAEQLDVTVYAIRHWEQNPDFELQEKYEPKLLLLIEDKLSIVNEENVQLNFFEKMKSTIGQISFFREAVIMYYCAMDPYTNKFAKATTFAALVYFINPIDLVPDFIPVAGFLDDAAMVTGAIASMRAYITERHEEKADEWLNNN